MKWLKITLKLFFGVISVVLLVYCAVARMIVTFAKSIR